MNVSKLYADDTKLLSEMVTEESALNLQRDLDFVLNWRQDWLIKFNINKYMVMHHGHNNENRHFFTEKRQLHESDTERDLGVIFSTDLKWKNQVLTATNKANQMLGRIKKSFAKFDCNLLRSLYSTFIRPLSEFAVPFWSPHLKDDSDMIERVQHPATKLVPTISNFDYEERLEALSLTTLTDRRLRGDTIQMYKFMHEIDEIDRINRFQVIQTQALGHSFKYHREISKKQQRYNFFFNQTVNIWNSLPNHLVLAHTVKSFKAQFYCWMSSNQSNRPSKCA